ncbi:histone H3.3 type c-like isoform X2 [Anastrepha obliqua]|uniref:histone H3.3 type c-like isoform X2 n=1 Tax=Anastrepha obliqua TaxID=95512 RepID=UPI00240A90DA|nr:histone H3.3 type c-like isoform X2 [Anastrepha obliqua]
MQPLTDASKLPFADLGETDTSCSEGSLVASDDREFHSPSRNNADTDYGLEFTASGSGYFPNVSKQQRPDGIASNLGKKNENCSGAITQREESSTTQVAPTPRKPLEGPENLLGAQTTSVSRKKTTRKSKSQFKALKDYQKLALRVDFMIPRAAFARVVREIMMSIDTDVRYITATALEALQVATEAYVEGRLEDANLLALHSRRVTLMAKDMELVNFLRNNIR